MSFFSSLFGGKAPAPAPAAPAPPPPPSEAQMAAQARAAVQDLQAKKSLVEKRQELLDQRMQKCLAEARARAAKNDKRGALACLKKKKLLENESAKYTGALANMERQIMMLESMAMDKTILEGFKGSHAVVKSMQANMSADEVEAVIDDMAEAMDDQEQISQAIGREIGGGVDEGALEDEFNELVEMDAASDLVMPSVPVGAPELDIPAMPALPALPGRAVAAPAAAPRVAVAAGGGGARPAPRAAAAPAVDPALADLMADFS